MEHISITEISERVAANHFRIESMQISLNPLIHRERQSKDFTGTSIMAQHLVKKLRELLKKSKSRFLNNKLNKRPHYNLA